MNHAAAMCKTTASFVSLLQMTTSAMCAIAWAPPDVHQAQLLHYQPSTPEASDADLITNSGLQQRALLEALDVSARCNRTSGDDLKKGPLHALAGITQAALDLPGPSLHRMAALTSHQAPAWACSSASHCIAFGPSSCKLEPCML